MTTLHGLTPEQLQANFDNPNPMAGIPSSLISVLMGGSIGGMQSPMGAVASQQQAQAPKMMPGGAAGPGVASLQKSAPGSAMAKLGPAGVNRSGQPQRPINTGVSPAMTQTGLGGPNQGGNPLAPQPPQSPQGSYQAPPSAYNDALTALFNASSGVDTSQLDAAIAAINDNAARQSGQVAAQTVSSALGSGAAGTPVAALANTAAGDVLSQANAQSQQTALDFLLGRSGQNISGLSNAAQLGLAGENQAFNQQLGAQNQQLNVLGMLMDAGALPRELEQQQINAQLAEFLRLQGADDQTIAQITGLISGTPFVSQPPIVPDILGGALAGGLLGAEAGNAIGSFSPNPSSPLSGINVTVGPSNPIGTVSVGGGGGGGRPGVGRPPVSF